MKNNLKKKLLDGFFITLPSTVLLLFVLCFKYFPQTLTYKGEINYKNTAVQNHKMPQNEEIANFDIRDVLDNKKEYKILISKGVIEVSDMDGNFVYTVNAFPEEFPKEDIKLLEDGIINLSSSKLVEIIDYLES